MDYDAVQEKLLSLRINYIANLVSNVEALQRQWQVICSATGNLEASLGFQRQLHNMRGTAKTFGCPEIGEIASTIENLLKQHLSPGARVSADLQLQITDLLHSLAAVARVC